MFFLLNISLLLMVVYFVCATPRSFNECYLIDCGDLCNCAKKSIFLYAVGMQHMRVCLDHQICHFLQIGLRLIAPGGMQIRQMQIYVN